MSKEAFKIFVKNHPELITTVKNNDYSWQKIYELYDLYGEDMSVWNNYITKEEKGDPSMQELINTVKKFDTDTIQRGISGIQRALELFSGLINKETENVEEVPKPYEPRPIYKKFED